ncbi:hypothetical protein KXW59_005032 [Aspergillus fumigatus]|nr:hypothetical protein KXW59_005032 [Aspergillus fumigatus]
MSAPGLDDCRMALITAHYEQEYERAVGRTTLVLEIERAREIRMQQLLLQFENDSLHLQLEETSGELVRARESESCLRVQFNKTLNEANRLKNILAASSREIENLRGELASLGNTAVESKRVVDENIRLSKEISNLQLEAERFRNNWRTKSGLTNVLTNEATGSPRPHAKPRAPANRTMGTQFVPTLTIATPGAIKSWNKGIKQPTALPGDKSSFSITPFLKRAGEPRNPSLSSDDDLNELHTVTVCAGTPGKVSSDKIGFAENATINSPQQEDELFPGGAPSKKQSELSHHIGTKSRMARAISSRSRSPHTDVETDAKGDDVPKNRAASQGQVKLKKRKLGFQRERNLFEDEEDPDNQDIRKPARKLAPGPGQTSRDDIQLTARSSIVHGRGFGAPTGFSPLKRDRKRM